MQALQGMAWLLSLQLVGEVLARLLGLPFPGPVIGMVLLLGALRFAAVRAPVAQAAGFLLQHLSLLFVPAGVGVVGHLDELSRTGLPLLVALVVSTVLAIAVGALTFAAVARMTGSKADIE